MKRLTFEDAGKHERQTGQFQSVKRAMAAAPLIAGLITAIGCSDAELPNDCRAYNGTTVTLNQAVDGQSVDLRSLENIPAGSFLTPIHIDFINEAYAIASEGLPQDTKATQSPSYCLMSGPNGRQRSAYAQQNDADGAQRGLYVPENQSLDSVTLINLTNHEIGHLQPGNPEHGSEVLSQLNEFEQKLAGFVVLQNQGADSGQLVRWAFHEAHSGLYQKLARTLESGRGRVGGEPLDAYDQANMFLFIRLGETRGDIPAIRSEFRERVADGTLEAALDEASAAFMAGHGTENLPDLFIDVRMRLIMAMERQYGQGAAYSEAHAGFLAIGPAIGLEGMNCALTAPLAPGRLFAMQRGHMR
ncbi:hypothetical protein L0Y65_01315 [Candidatus Micrarchaeota archaeon]|nr:hypothetical protein [Candidatus Micrarchaeota archaeon]